MRLNIRIYDKLNASYVSDVSDIYADLCKLAKHANLPQELLSNIFEASEFVRDEINSFLEENEQKAKNIMKKERQ